MSDPQNFSLGELGQRLQAMSDPAPEPRLRPYQGSPLSPGSGGNGRVIPAYEPAPAGNSRAAANIPEAPGPLHPATASLPPYQDVPQAAQPVQPEPPAAQQAAAPPAGSSAAQQPSQASAQASSQQPPASSSTPSDPNAKSGLSRAIDAVRSTLPLVQRLLPLLEGNVLTAITSLAAAPQFQPKPQPPVPPQVHVNLEPVERGLAEIRTGHIELRSQVQQQAASLKEQAASFKRVEDQLDRVREATDRNTLEQQELVEDLRSVGSRLGTFAIIGLALLALSLGLNIYLMFQLQHILR